MNLSELLAQSARRYPERGAVYLGPDQVSSYAELEARMLRLATSLLRRAGRCNRILIASKNCPEFVEIMFAAWAAGMVVVPVNAKLHEREIVEIMADAEPVLAFASPSIAAAVGPLLEAAGVATEIITIGSSDYHAMLAEEPATPCDMDPEELAWLFYTSGTTGRSKGAMLSVRNLMAMTVAHLADFDAVDAEGSLLHAAPMSHGSGLLMLPYIMRGARQVIPASAGYDAAEFIDLCEVHPRVAAFLAPTMVQRLRLEKEASGRKPANLNLVIYGGGPMYLTELKRALDSFGPIFVNLYGQGEAPMTITGLRRLDHLTDDEAVLGSVGWPRSGVEVAIFNDNDDPVGIGEVGEIVCRGDIVMRGYWKNGEATAETLKGGWLRTGDMGSFDRRGCLTLRDRSKDVIISGGTNIYPREVEEALLTCPGVTEVAVLGQPHSEWGEIVVAFVVADSGSAPSEADLDAHCLSRIARFKRPKTYIFVEALPKSSYGKVLKRALIVPDAGSRSRVG